jgi:hypothetical protein
VGSTAENMQAGKMVHPLRLRRGCWNGKWNLPE